MCGICGIFGNNNQYNIEPMVAAMHHRGPDDKGIFQEEGIALGMARLAIIDITPKGHQPMSNHDRNIWIVYNWETYNFRVEREILQKKGYAFNSTSDTEVVLRMYEEYGDDFLLRMRGMFALAIYDKRRGPGKEKLLLARDHLGIKPLIYSRVGSDFIFASEIKSILASGFVKREIDYEALRLLLTFVSVTQPRTIIRGVKMLLPGHRLIIESGNERLERYWKLETNREVLLKTKNYNEILGEFKYALEECVRLQMVSDVPVGAFLSGGIDSSLLVAIMSKIKGANVKTFSIGFGSEGVDIDETDSSQNIAKYIGTDHTRVVVTGQDLCDNIIHIVRSLDQPSMDGPNTYFVSLAARKSVTVAISGLGGDELVAGYPCFIKMAGELDRFKHDPLNLTLRKFLSNIASIEFFDIFSSGMFGGILNKIRNLYGLTSRYARHYEIFGSNGTARILSPEVKHLIHVGRKLSYDIDYADELKFASAIERTTALCLRSYTQNQLLRDTDAVSMSHSLEVRVPYLDHIIVDNALSLPDDLKLGNITYPLSRKDLSYFDSGAKKILFDISKNLLPDGMDVQKKSGFGMSFAYWLKHSLREVMDDTLSLKTINNRGLFNFREVQSVKNNFLSGKTYWPCPWLLMIIELWCREVLDR